MTPQVVDLNGDKLNDLVIATFEGTVFLLEGTQNGFRKPTHIKDCNGTNIRISMFADMDGENGGYSEVDRSAEGEKWHKQHHMTSVATVDWDDDGDFDLILGAKQGGLYRCMNIGSATKPKFAAINHQVMAGEEHMMFGTRLAAPRICDFNSDGKFDILCGGREGGVFMFENLGTKSEPKFGERKVLIESNGSSFAKTLAPTENGFLIHPIAEWHVEPVDYDNDGHLDLLVGGRAKVETKGNKLNDEEQAKLDELTKQRKAVSSEMAEMFNAIDENAPYSEVDKLAKSDEFKKLGEKFQEIKSKIRELVPAPKTFELIWLYRNKGP